MFKSITIALILCPTVSHSPYQQTRLLVGCHQFDIAFFHPLRVTSLFLGVYKIKQLPLSSDQDTSLFCSFSIANETYTFCLQCDLANLMEQCCQFFSCELLQCCVLNPCSGFQAYGRTYAKRAWCMNTDYYCKHRAFLTKMSISVRESYCPWTCACLEWRCGYNQVVYLVYGLQWNSEDIIIF